MMNDLVKILTQITVVRPGDTIMLSLAGIRSVSDITRIETILKLKEWSAKTGINYVLMPADIRVDVLRPETQVGVTPSFKHMEYTLQDPIGGINPDWYAESNA